MSSTGKKFIVVGGGIGGLAAAVALSQQGVHVTVLEQASELGEIGAGKLAQAFNWGPMPLRRLILWVWAKTRASGQCSPNSSS